MTSFKSRITTTTAVLALSSGMSFSAFAGAQPKAESHRVIKLSETSNSAKDTKLTPSIAVDKTQHASIEKFIKDFSKGTFKEGFESMSQSSTSVVTVDYFLNGDIIDYTNDLIDWKGKAIEYELPPYSEVIKILIMPKKPIDFESAKNIANDVQKKHLLSVSVMRGPAFKPERDSKGEPTGNIATIAFFGIKKK